MDEYRVPTVQVEAEVYWADGRTLGGHIFLPEQSAISPGPMAPTEWVNRDTRFFPFRLQGGPGMLVNKRQVIAIAVPNDLGGEEGAAPLDVPIRRVVVEAGGRSFEGSVSIDMPVSQQRLVDLLNRDDSFFLLHATNGRDYLIQKDHASRVREVEGVE